MPAKLVLSPEECAVDPELGYPPGYAKLCRHAYFQMQGLITPFTEGPPQRFLPYPAQHEEIAKMKEFEGMFPIVSEEQRDPSSARRHGDFLWQHLDHLGNAGFDPAKFRVDGYGNVLYWYADFGSPLGWEIDHWFPHSRGGKTIVSNLRVVQWQVNQRKNKRLEFLIPWWDLHLGVSVNQFLSVFASKNADFRHRAFSFLFVGGENEPLDEGVSMDCHTWPSHFREKRKLYGLAPAAIVRMQKDMDEPFQNLIGNNNNAHGNTTAPVNLTGTPSRRRWTVEEEDGLRRALMKFGPGCWKEIKEFEPALMNRSTMQIKDKFRLMKGDWKSGGKENTILTDILKQQGLTAELEKVQQLKRVQEEEKKRKEEEVMRVEEELKVAKQENEKERVALQDLESILAKQKRRVEKQRRWSETQSQYRLCLEKMIRDTMHQSGVYKEQARLNQAACNALLARLDFQKSTCDAAEFDLIKRCKERESLEVLTQSSSKSIIMKHLREASKAEKVGDLRQHLPNMPLRWIPSNGDGNEKGERGQLVLLHDDDMDSTRVSTEGEEEETEVSLGENIEEEDIEEEEEEYICQEEDEEEDMCEEEEEEDICEEEEEEEEEGEESETSLSGSGRSGLKRKAAEMSCSELDVVLMGYEFEEEREEEGRGESVGDNALQYEDGEGGIFKEEDEEEDCWSKTGGKEMDDELLQEVLTMQGKVNDAMVDAISEEEDRDALEKAKLLGKSNLDRWLQMLLLNTQMPSTITQEEENKEDKEEEKEEKSRMEKCGQSSLALYDCPDPPCPTIASDMEANNKPKGIMGGLLRKLSFKQLPLDDDDNEKKHRLSLAKEPSLPNKAKEEHHGDILDKLENLHLHQDGEREKKNGDVYIDKYDEFVKRMREVREDDEFEKKKHQLSQANKDPNNLTKAKEEENLPLHQDGKREKKNGEYIDKYDEFVKRMREVREEDKMKRSEEEAKNNNTFSAKHGGAMVSRSVSFRVSGAGGGEGGGIIPSSIETPLPSSTINPTNLTIIDTSNDELEKNNVEEEGYDDDHQKGSLRRKSSFSLFNSSSHSRTNQPSEEGVNTSFRTSITQVWKKAVKKLEGHIQQQ